MAARSKRSSATATKRAAPKAKAKAKVKSKAKVKPEPKVKAKAIAKPKVKARAIAKPKVKAKAAAKARARARARAAPPPPSPSERVLAAYAEPPVERPITPEERSAMAKVGAAAAQLVAAGGEPSEIVAAIAAFVDDVRCGRREEPKSHDLRLGLGVLWGEQLRSQAGWSWVHLSYPDGFASYALVPDDRAFACFPLNRIPDALRTSGTNTSAHVFESIKCDVLPTRKAKTYLVIG